ncbi:T9SS type A sorting domain-containing protein [Pontibacter harenae]|uniref:T9SS type A sorting domain-containing protein n=1 Tax=Pontibacter harenae TaxID=2894083 RepID=UPI001E384618|nr:T9SS type A sorting domain-containing protein [Pontibacter harenae]MCC9166887.1 T9SS type A sorting domain-containing protein [Pontibacter harenae]
MPKIASAQVSLNPHNTSYTQNFDALPAAGTGIWENGTEYIPGWFIQRTYTAGSTVLVGTGSSNTGGLYSFGLSGSTDRALGAISSGTATVGEFAWGLLIQNNTGATLTALHVTYAGEQWRSASRTAGEQETTFWYSTNASPTAFNLHPRTDVGWTAVPDLNFKSLVSFSAPGALNGNSPTNRRILSATIPVDVPTGHYAMLRWKDLNDLDDDHGLAIDNFSLTWSTDAAGQAGILPVELVSFSAKLNGNLTVLNWKTASEENNKHFIVERSSDGRAFEGVGLVEGKGTTSAATNYSFTDERPLPGLSYYRLKQVDEDETYFYSSVVAVTRSVAKADAKIFPTITSDVLHVESTAAVQALVIDVMGQQLLNQKLTKDSYRTTISLNHLSSGTYVLVLVDELGKRQSFRFVKR